MSSEEVVSRSATVSVEKVGGIDRTQVSLDPGVTVLSGRNATNRTSFLQSVMAAMGSERPSLKGDADEGHATLELGDERFTRTLTRTNGTVSFDGDPYLEDPEIADRFAFLLENNEARRAVERGDDLHEVIMRPIDTAEIESEIERLEAEKRDLDSEIERLRTLERDLPEFEAEKRSVETELAETREGLAAVEAELEELDADLEESRTRKEELEAVFEDLRTARSELEDLEFDLETERATVEELVAEREELEAELEEGADGEASPERLAGRIEELRNRKRDLDGKLSDLQSVINFNEGMLEGDGLDVEGAFDTDADAGDVTDRLLADDGPTVCWTCGSEVEAERIEETLDRLREMRKEQLSERNDLRDRIDELTQRRKELKRREQERERAERRLDGIDDELAAARERIAELESAREAQAERVGELEARTESFDDTDHSEVLETHREANRLGLEVERLESDLADVEERIADREAEIDRREELLERREAVSEELTELRTRVDRIEADAVESFNEHMASILDALEYENVERVWIERQEQEVREGRRTVTRSTFDLHIVRAADDGTTYRDTVDHLSESEREVTGLVFALAGYLVHDVHEQVPFMVLDSLEAIDSDRIAAVVGYFEQYVDFLVVALLPEDAAALPESYSYVTEV